MSCRVLVLGATGKTGKRLLLQLRNRNVRVAAAMRRPEEARSLVGVDRVRFDWNKPRDYATVLKGIDTVYLVPPPLVEDASTRISTFLDQGRSFGLCSVVLLSSLGVTFAGEPLESGRNKHAAAVRESGFIWTILRSSGFFQNFSEGMAQQSIRNEGAIITATGDGAAALADAEDIAAVAAQALTRPGHEGATYALTGPVAVTFAEADAVIGLACGRKVMHVPVAPDAVEAFLRDAAVPEAYRQMLRRDMAAIREGYAAQTSGEIERVTGRKPTAIQTYAQAAVDAWKRS